MTVTVYSHSTGQGYEAWPAAIRLNDNSLLCAFSDGTAHTGNNTLVKVCKSTDHGATWGSALTVCDESGSSIRCLTSLGMVQLASGRILLPYSREDNGTLAILSPKLKRSDDGGATWAAHSTVATPSGYDWVFSYGTIRELTPGGTLYMPAYGQKTSGGHLDSLLLQSTNGGVDWTLKSVIAAGDASHEYDETDIINMSGTTWLAIIRDEGAGNSVTRRCTSSDDCATWGAVSLFDSAYTVSPCLYKIASDNIILSYAYRSAGISGAPNSGVVTYKTVDQNVNWTGGAYVYDAGSAIDLGYPALVPSNGLLYVAYYDNAHDVLFASTGESVPADPNVIVALSGQAVTSSSGSLARYISVSVSGQSAAASPGALVPIRSVSLLGQEILASAGDITVGGDKTVSLSGVAVTSSIGQIGVAASRALTGAEISAMGGSFSAAVSRALLGSLVAVSAGTMVSGGGGAISWSPVLRTARGAAISRIAT